MCVCRGSMSVCVCVCLCVRACTSKCVCVCSTCTYARNNIRFLIFELSKAQIYNPAGHFKCMYTDDMDIYLRHDSKGGSVSVCGGGGGGGVHLAVCQGNTWN